MKRTRTWIAAAAACAAVLIVFLYTRTSDEARIRKSLSRLEKILSKKGDEGFYALLGKTDALSRLLTEECSIDVKHPSVHVRTRGAVIALSGRALRAVSRLKVRFHDVKVTVAEEGGAARAVLTATAEGPDIEGVLAVEVETAWVKEEGKWLLSRVREIPVLR